MFRRIFVAITLAATVLLAACAAPSPTAAPPSPATTVPPAVSATQPPAAAPTKPPEPTKAPEVSKVGGTLNLVAVGDPDTLDLQQTSQVASGNITGQIYEKLVYLDLDKTYKGLLAESWTVSPDNKVITFKLRQGIVFSDGSPFNAEAVKFTYERLQRVGSKASIYTAFQNVEKMEAPDDYTFIVRLKEPAAPFLHDLVANAAGILSPSAVKAANDKIDRVAVGTGAYKLKEWKVGQEIILERNPTHKEFRAYLDNKGAPYIQEKRYKIVPEAATQLVALEAGELDAIALRPQDIAKYEKDARFKIYDSYATGNVYLAFDAAKPPFDNPKLRQALAYPVNKDEIVQVVLEGKTGRRACCPIAESIQGYDPKLKEYELNYNPAKAKQLLDELGYKPGADGMRQTPDGKSFAPAIYTTTSETFGKVATLLQAQYKAVGINMQVKPMESAALLALTPTKQHDLFLNSYNWNEPDMFTVFLSCDRLQSGNRAQYCNQDLEKMIVAGRAELDQIKRMKIYFDAQKFVMEQAVWQPLYNAINKVAVSTKIKDVKQGPEGDPIFHDAYIAK
jgi:peptide/nickel transport system substrate-binding protein